MFAASYPTPSGKASDIDEALKKFLQEYGAPETLTMDGSKAQTARGSIFAARVRRNNTVPIICNPYRPNMTPCETVIREVRKRWYRLVFRTNCPITLWNYGIPYVSKVM